MIKILATDLDGTLFYPKRKIKMVTNANRRLLRDFENAGGEVVLVTGRSMATADKINRKLKTHVALLGCDGAFVYDEGKMKDRHPIDRKDLMELYMRMRAEYGIIGWLAFDDTKAVKIAPTNISKLLSFGAWLFNFFQGAYAEKYVFSEKVMIETLANKDVYKVMPMFGISKKASEKAKQALMALNDIFGQKLSIVAASQALEITAGGINKAKTLLEYIKERDIKPEEVAVCGDSDNDLSLFENFQHSFAMESGEESVKSKASAIIHSVADVRPYLLDKDGHLLA